MTEQLQIRVYGEASQPTLIFLPGMHGDWTLIRGFRKALRGRVRFVEFTYPRTLTWSLDDYAAGIESALAEKGITQGWLLGESFGSQIVWPLVARGKFQIEGVILAGGFVRHPMRWAVRLAERALGRASLALVTKIIFGYAKIARFRFRRSPEILPDIDEFVQRRTKLDKQAATYRLHLIAQNDFRAVAQQAHVPIYAITGWLDPIVPWPWTRRWLLKNCSALRDFKIVRRADHNVLGTGARESAEQIVEWITIERTTL